MYRVAVSRAQVRIQSDPRVYFLRRGTYFIDEVQVDRNRSVVRRQNFLLYEGWIYTQVGRDIFFV